MSAAASAKSACSVAKDNTDVAAKTVTDDERQLRFQVVQAFINVLLAKSVLATSPKRIWRIFRKRWI